MNLSTRLKSVAMMVDKCHCVADIGTDHGYIPIYLVNNKLCDNVIACDINKKPLKKALANINSHNLDNKIECRLSNGLKKLKIGEVQGIIIAGMGGNLIRDILEDGIDVFKKVDFAIFQPMQNTDVLREYIYKKGYNIINENLCIDENKFYEIIKVKYDNNPRKVDEIFYEISEKLIDTNHPDIKKFILAKLNKYREILENIKETTDLALERKFELKNKIQKLEEILICL
ncbi:SAM-dependent methyltransferase [Clostridium fermenticellae]|uniref:SAM-dependent methyltransferase n=1 Tax=Clostridium fermenticellae TaxID=2068654 RepID=A0A386H623_9CLOT|nr:class I SAM-dependent methyltransferase [Clostridium fermenticellae]AYD40965.1 SAM-dependent methyltransferase [Clostridium fermenticellae]